MSGDAPLHVQRWYAAAEMYRIQDRKDACTMRAALRSPAKGRERHVLAWMDGELLLSDEWRLKPCLDKKGKRK